MRNLDLLCASNVFVILAGYGAPVVAKRFPVFPIVPDDIGSPLLQEWKREEAEVTDPRENENRKKLLQQFNLASLNPRRLLACCSVIDYE